MTRIEKETESPIVSAICEYLELRQRCFWRANNIPAFNKKEDGTVTMRRLPAGSRRGVPDINLVAGGLYWGLEVKTSIGKQSKEQKEIEALIKKHGGRYHVVCSVDDVISLGL